MNVLTYSMIGFEVFFFFFEVKLFLAKILPLAQSFSVPFSRHRDVLAGVKIFQVIILNPETSN